MARGGPRNRSGPQPDPKSKASERRGYVLTALPNEGYDGPAPDFPLMPHTVMRWEFDDKKKYQVVDTEATAEFRDREQELWEQAWTYPQACAWSQEPWRWSVIALWCRTMVICESSSATAADKSAVHRFADQIGMTPAGLKENGWAIAPVEIKSAEKPTGSTSPAPGRRLRSAG